MNILESLNKDILSEISECLLHFDLRNLKFAFAELSLTQNLFEVTKERSIEYIKENYSADFDKSIEQLINGQDQSYLVKSIERQNNRSYQVIFDPYVYQTIFNMNIDSFAYFKVYRFFVHYIYENNFVYQYIIKNGYQLFKTIAKSRKLRVEQLNNLAPVSRIITQNTDNMNLADGIKQIIIDTSDYLLLEIIDQYTLTVELDFYNLTVDDLSVDLETLNLIYSLLNRRRQKYLIMSIQEKNNRHSPYENCPLVHHKLSSFLLNLEDNK